MSDRARPGHITLTLEMPIEVAEWLASNGEQIGQMARIAATNAQHHSEASKKKREERSQKNIAEFWALGRLGYRLHRRAGGGKNIATSRNITRTIAAQLGVDWQTLEIAITRFKAPLQRKLRQRRNREFIRMYKAGASNQDIAARYDMHPNSVAVVLREHPGKRKTLKGNKKGARPESSPVASPVISWDIVKQAGERS